MSQDRGTSRTLLLFLAAVTLIIAGMLIFGGCDSSQEYYSMKRNCVMVEKDSTYRCYKTHESYAIHEGVSLFYAREHFKALKLEAEKKKAIMDSVEVHPHHMKNIIE